MHHRFTTLIEQSKCDMAACAATFGIYELREHILSHLPPRDIFVVRRVAKGWHAIIDHSRIVARSRCVSPIRCEHVVPLEDREFCGAIRRARTSNFARNRRTHSRMLEREHRAKELLLIEDVQLKHMPHYDEAFRLQINPFLAQTQATGKNLADKRRSARDQWPVAFINLPDSVAGTTARNWHRRRDEYVTYPPCSTMVIEVYYQTTSPIRKRSFKLEVRTGIKISDLLEAHVMAWRKSALMLAARALFIPSVDGSRLRKVHYGPAQW